MFSRTRQFCLANIFGLLLVVHNPAWSQEAATGTEAGATTPADPTTPTDPTPPTEQPPNRFETRVEFLDRAALDEFELAATAGVQLIELVEAEEGPNSIELANVLTEVGEVQRRAEQHEAAERNLLRAIDIYQLADGPASAKLIDPMVSLGLSYHDSEKYAPAVVMFSEARSINRRNYGLLNEDQLPIIGHLTNSYIRLRDYEQAYRKQLEGLRLSQRVHGVDTMESLPAIYTYANFLRNIGGYDEARYYYNNAIRVIHDKRGKLDPALAYPLREIGNSYREQGLPEGIGASSLKRSIEVLEQAEPMDYIGLAQSYRDLGDWYTAFSRVGRGAAEYEKAWQLLEESEMGSELQEQWFATRRPKFVRFVPPSPRGLRAKGSEPGLKEGFVTIQFDLLANGKTDNVTILESDPAGAKDESAIRSMRSSRLRPNIVDGKVVRTEGLKRRYLFSYKPDAF